MLYGLTHIYVTSSDLQLEALKQLYYNTNGDQWKHNGNWSLILQNRYNTTNALSDSTGCDSFDTCSAMYGVYCYLNTITEIKLGNNSLSGTQGRMFRLNPSNQRSSVQVKIQVKIQVNLNFADT